VKSTRITTRRGLGADIIGGCCRVRPADIAQIARTARSAPPGNA
jgi:S-methylmethionine-dependent homocysteine/selenocysteine methylase